MCSAPWYSNTRWRSGSREISHEVGQEDRDPHQLLDHHEDERVRDRVPEEVGQPGRQQEEQADREQQREHDRAGPRAAADLLLLALLVGRDLGVGGDAERLEADLERLAERDHAAHDRQRAAAVPLATRTRAARRSPRSRPWRPPWSRARRRPSCSLGGLAHRDRPGRDAAHHHALEDGLAADRGVAEASRVLAGTRRWRVSADALTCFIVSARGAGSVGQGQPSRQDVVVLGGLPTVRSGRRRRAPAAAQAGPVKLTGRGSPGASDGHRREALRLAVDARAGPRSRRESPSPAFVDADRVAGPGPRARSSTPSTLRFGSGPASRSASSGGARRITSPSRVEPAVVHAARGSREPSLQAAHPLAVGEAAHARRATASSG